MQTIQISVEVFAAAIFASLIPFYGYVMWTLGGISYRNKLQDNGFFDQISANRHDIEVLQAENLKEQREQVTDPANQR